MALAGASFRKDITDQITDYFAPYYYELATTARYEINVLALTQRISKEYNSSFAEPKNWNKNNILRYNNDVDM